MSIKDILGDERGQTGNRANFKYGAAVWTDNPNAAIVAGCIARSDKQDASVFHFRGVSWQNELTNFSQKLSSEDREACYVAAYDEDGLWHPWLARPLDDVVAELSTDWFPAILNGTGLTAFLQPIICLTGMKFYGYEALARACITGKIISGAELFAAAESHQAAAKLDQSARLAAINVATDQLQADEALFINIIPGLMDRASARMEPTWAAIENAGIKPSRIVFEFVESHKVSDHETLDLLVTTIRANGAQIAIDDFGLGHNSLYLVEHIMPDVVKFDRSMLLENPNNVKGSVVESLVRYCDSLGIKTIAEGVETMEHLAFVQSCNFDMAQGWLIGKPSGEIIRADRPVWLS